MDRNELEMPKIKCFYNRNCKGGRTIHAYYEQKIITHSNPTTGRVTRKRLEPTFVPVRVNTDTSFEVQDIPINRDILKNQINADLVELLDLDLQGLITGEAVEDIQPEIVDEDVTVEVEEYNVPTPKKRVVSKEAQKKRLASLEKARKVKADKAAAEKKRRAKKKEKLVEKYKQEEEQEKELEQIDIEEVIEE